MKTSAMESTRDISALSGFGPGKTTAMPHGNVDAVNERMWDPSCYFYKLKDDVDLAVAYDGSIGFGTLTPDILASAEAYYTGMVRCSFEKSSHRQLCVWFGRWARRSQN